MVRRRWNCRAAVNGSSRAATSGEQPASNGLCVEVGLFSRLAGRGLAARRSNVSVVWEQEQSGRVKTPFEPLVLAATLAMIPVLIIEADATSSFWRAFAFVANWVIWAVFAAEVA